jgi:replicative DNA helicase
MSEVHYIRPNDAEPVYSPESEQMVLGAILLDQQVIGKVITAGGDALFSDPVHADIFRTALERDRAGQLVSPVTITEAMRGHAGLNEVATGYLARLAGSSPGPSSIPGYLSLLADLRRKREIGAAMQEAQKAIASGDMGADHIAARLEAALMASEPAGGDGPVSMLKAVTGAMEQARSAYAGESAGVHTGIGRLDKILGGLYPGDLVYLGGRPSMGKTAVGLCVALNAARQGNRIAIASLEMTPEAMAMRALSEQTSRQCEAVTYSSMRRGEMHDAQVASLRQAAGVVAELPITFLPRQYNDIGALTAGVKQIARTGDLHLVIVDYLQLMRSGVRGNTNEQVSDISKSLKALAMQLGVPVLALSQLSRAVEQRQDKRPVLSDLRDSGSIEQDADSVMFCYRDEYYLEREEPDISDPEAHEAWRAAMKRARNRLEIVVAKQRQGEIGTARVFCNPAINVIWED